MGWFAVYVLLSIIVGGLSSLFFRGNYTPIEAATNSMLIGLGWPLLLASMAIDHVRKRIKRNRNHV